MHGILSAILNEDKITGKQIHDFFKYICPTLYPFLVGVLSIDMIKENVKKLKKCHFLVFNESVKTSPGVTVLEKNMKNFNSALNSISVWLIGHISGEILGLDT